MPALYIVIHIAVTPYVKDAGKHRHDLAIMRSLYALYAKYFDRPPVAMKFTNLHHRRSVPIGTARLTYDVPALNEAPVLAGVWWSGGIAPRIINISDKRHDSTSSPQGNEPSVPIGQRGWMATERVES